MGQRAQCRSARTAAGDPNCATRGVGIQRRQGPQRNRGRCWRRALRESGEASRRNWRVQLPDAGVRVRCEALRASEGQWARGRSTRTAAGESSCTTRGVGI
eukprot:7794242-Alexandrium_andersonii.AAC.1